MKRTDPQLIGDIVDKILQDEGMTDTFREQKVCYLWPEVVGQGINRLTTRRFVDHGVLHVYISSAALKQELMMNRQKLAEALNRAVGANVITSVQFH